MFGVVKGRCTFCKRNGNLIEFKACVNGSPCEKPIKLWMFRHVCGQLSVYNRTSECFMMLFELTVWMDEIYSAVMFKPYLFNINFSIQ